MSMKSSVTCSSAARDQRQPGENQRQQQKLGDLEGAAQRPVEDVAADHVGRGQRHQAEQQHGGGGAQRAIEPGAQPRSVFDATRERR